jgi:uroporphyrin-III C-methyltransferase
MRQAEINALLVRRGLLGQRVVRLKGGDPLIFGRGGEEIEALVEAGVPFEIVPGVTAAAGCAATTAIPLTHRDHSRTLVLVTGHTKDGEPELNWQALCQPGQTLVFYMGHKALDRLCARLIEHGLPGDLPAALIENGTLPGQRAVRATLCTIAAEVERMTLQGPALLVVGEVVAFARGLAGAQDGLERA